MKDEFNLFKCNIYIMIDLIFISSIIFLRHRLPRVEAHTGLFTQKWLHHLPLIKTDLLIQGVTEITKIHYSVDFLFSST